MKNYIIMAALIFLALFLVTAKPVFSSNHVCIENAGCDDNDRCTEDICTEGVCAHNRVPGPGCTPPFIENKWEFCNLPSPAANIILPIQLCPVTDEKVDIVKCAVVCDEDGKQDIRRVSALEFKPEFKRCELDAIAGTCSNACRNGINTAVCKECVLRLCDKEGVKISEQELTVAPQNHVCRRTSPIFDPEYNDAEMGKCRGEPGVNSCSVYNETQCTGIPGCTPVIDPNTGSFVTCTGQPISCPLLTGFGRNKCEETRGCSWTECDVFNGTFRVKSKDLGHYTVVVAAEDTANGCSGTPEPDACKAYTKEQCRLIQEQNLGCKLDSRCEGTPRLSCRQLGLVFGENKCLETKGCFLKGQCLGSFLCSQIPVGQCLNTPGCRLIQRGGVQLCLGTSSCSQFDNNEAACKAKRGCTFQKVCDGTPQENACENYNLDQCRRIRGCSIKEGCTGTPQSCKAVGEKFGIQKCLETKGCNLTHSILQNQFELNVCLLPVPPKQFCGDLVVQPPEQCDPPGGLCQNAGAVGICDSQCQCQTGGGGGPFCGNNVIEFPPETCDPPGFPCVDPFTGAPGICSLQCGCQSFNGNHGGIL